MIVAKRINIPPQPSNLSLTCCVLHRDNAFIENHLQCFSKTDERTSAMLNLDAVVYSLCSVNGFKRQQAIGGAMVGNRMSVHCQPQAVLV